MKFIVIFGLFLVTVLTGCIVDSEIEISQAKNQKTIFDQTKNLYYDLHDLHLNGNVKAVLEFDLMADTLLETKNFLKIKSIDSLAKLMMSEMESKDINFFKFNEAGQVVNRIHISDGDNYFNYQHKFNEKGNLIEVNKFDSQMKTNEIERLKYDEDERLISHEARGPYNLFKRKTKVFYEKEFMIFHYSDNHDSTEIQESKYRNGEFQDEYFESYRVKREYDKNGNLTKYLLPYSDSTGTILHQTNLREYNANQQLIREVEYNNSNEIFGVKTFLYSKEGRLLQRVEVDETRHRIWQYNKFNNLISFSSSSHDPGSPYGFSHLSQRFDKFGNQTSRQSFGQNENGEIYKNISNTQIEYDSFGNWTKKAYFENDSLLRNEVRIIWFENG